MNYVVKTALDHKFILGEGPVWDEKTQKLFYIDSLGNAAGVFDPETGENRLYAAGQNVGTLVLTERSDTVILGLEDGLYSLNLSTGELVFKADPEGKQGNRLNDGKADSRGRIWIGSMCTADNGVEGYDTPCRCGLYKVDTDFSCSAADREIRLGNGIAWTQDDKTMYFVDSPTRSVFKYDFDAETGTASNKQICINIPESFGVCDGMDIDIDGNLWIAHWTGWCVGKWNPATGELLGKIELPVSRVSSCAFGGPNFDKLYITTANAGADNDDIKQPDAGKIFVAENLGTRGLPFNRFKG